jgi:small subunit ribosomal protein S11
MTDENKDKAPEAAEVKAKAPAKEKKAKAPKAPKAETQATDTEAKVASAEAAPAKKEKSTKEETPSEAAPVAAAPRKVETAADLLSDDVGDLKIRRAKGSKNVVSGVCHVLATFNNTLITFTDKAGNTIARSSSGKCGFKGAKKSTAYAAQVVCQDAAKQAMAHGLKEVEIRLCGPGMGRDSAVRALQTLGIGVSSLIDVTPVPHNGCRARKRRRV